MSTIDKLFPPPRGLEYYFWLIISLLAFFIGVGLLVGMSIIMMFAILYFPALTMWEKAATLHFFIVGPACILVGTIQALKGFKNRHISRMRRGAAISVFALILGGVIAAGINAEGEAKVREALRSPSQTGIGGE